MKLLYFAMLRQATGKIEEEWDCPAKTLGELMEALVARYGREFGRWVFDGGKLSNLAIVLVNGRDARHIASEKTPLEPGDQIAIFPPVAGG